MSTAADITTADSTLDYAPRRVLSSPPEQRSSVPELPLESRSKRLAFLFIAAALAIAYFAVVLAYWTPSHPGVDQNGYLVGGKGFAETLSMKQAPVRLSDGKTFDPHQFIANMWVSATNNSQHFYPKYPLGLPLLYAICLWLGGGSSSYGVAMAHLISPAAMALTVFGVFVLVRQFAGSFPAVLAMCVFATSPIVGWCVNNPNSHATTVFCCVWGMVSVLHWWRRGGWFWALAGGFLVGYAATIRYTEGAMLLPLLFAALINLRWRSWRGWFESSLVPIGWAIPVAVLLTYNWFEMGTLTGYDSTNESTGFAWAYFYTNWETILRQLSLNGLFLIFPIAVAGLIAMFWWNWRAAVLLWLWVGPCLTIYTFYYWAPDGLGYLRFVLTVLPPLLVGGFWVIAHLRDLLPDEPTNVPAYLLVLVLTFGGITAGVLGHLGLRLDLQALSVAMKGEAALVDPESADPAEPRSIVQSVKSYLAPAPSAYASGEARPVFYASLLMLAAWGAAVAASALFGRSIVPTLAAGVIAFLSIAVQADNSFKALEKESHERNVQLISYKFLEKYVPDGSVLICREEGLLHHVQFERNLVVYNGMTFDKNWVNGRVDAPRDNPDLMDPVRGKQLKDALKDFDQNALNEQARALVRDARNANRRVFVIETVPNMNEMLKAFREKKEGPVPDFVRRYINRSKDESIKGERITYWNVPQVVRDPIPPHRGRRDARPNFRVVTWQLWEIKVS